MKINILTYSELKLLHGDSESKDCPKQSCPVCEKEPCPKQSCPECPSNTGWVIATLILLLVAVILFILKIIKSNR